MLARAMHGRPPMHRRDLDNELEAAFRRITEETELSAKPTVDAPLPRRRGRLAAGTSPAPDPSAHHPADRSAGVTGSPQHGVGQIISERYELLGLLGRGGSGTVYRARHVVTRRLCAVKILTGSFSREPTVVGRLQREAFATARLSHVNCVRVWDAGTTADGLTYLVMELLTGRSLAYELETFGCVELERALLIIRQCLMGLAHAHTSNVVHRDVKPENVFLVAGAAGDEVVKLVDFGIAKLVGDALAEAGGQELTRTGITVGTPHYMSPEQLRGRDIDARTDIYSATVMLYELAAGVPPYDAPHPFRIAQQHQSAPVPQLSAAIPDSCRGVEAQLDALIARGMAKELADRFQCAEDFVEAIDDILDALDSACDSKSSPRG